MKYSSRVLLHLIMRTHPGFIEVTLASALFWHFAIPCSAIFDFASSSFIDVQKESDVEFGATWLEDNTKKDHDGQRQH